MPITPGLYRHFSCPLCQTEDYHYVLYTREGRDNVVMSWFKCAGCSVMFNDPERFTRQVRRVPEINGYRDTPQRGEGPIMSELDKLRQKIDEQHAIDEMNRKAQRPVQRPAEPPDRSTGQSTGKSTGKSPPGRPPR
jgi:hypothetical protein